MKKSSKKFEKKYFEGYFRGAVGDFQKKDLEMSAKWFYSWIKKLGQYVSLNDAKGKKILEIGCSIGGVARILKDKGFSVYASDISSLAVKKARKLSPDITFFEQNIENKIRINEKFDFVIAFEVVEHLKNPQKAIQNMIDVLKPGGYLIISTPYPYPWSYMDPTHINVLYPNEWVTMMKRGKLKKVYFHKFSLIPYFYKLNKHFQIIIPFHIPIPYINNPIFFIGQK